MSDLETATNEELFDELAKRFDAIVLSAVKKLGGCKESEIGWYRGGRATCAGLCEIAKYQMLDEDGEPVDNDDV